MKLINVKSYELVEVLDSSIPPYAILSHTWGGDDTVAPTHWTRLATIQRSLPIPEKVIRACEDVHRRGITYLWVDSLCIDSSSSADLDEAVNGSLRRLRNASVCLVFLEDLPADSPAFDDNIWRKCRYWQRAWTVQELIVPSQVDFFDKQWNYRGSKTSSDFLPLLSNITGVPKTVLTDGNTLSEISMAARMSWLADKIGNREEDVAYSLVAIAGVTLQVRYGEGAERAFLRLQEEVLQDTRDGSIFAWRSANKKDIRGLLARSPSEFRHFSATTGSDWQAPWIFDGKVRFSSKGIQIQSQISRHGSCILLEIGRVELETGKSTRVGVYLREWNGIYVRVDAESGAIIPGAGRYSKIDAARDVSSQTSMKISSWLSSVNRRVHNTLREKGPGNPEASTRDFQGQQMLAVADHDNGDTLGGINGLQKIPVRFLEHLLGNDSSQISCHISSTQELLGAKRGRSGQPVNTIHNSQQHERHPSLRESSTNGSEISAGSSTESDNHASSSDMEFNESNDPEGNESAHDNQATDQDILEADNALQAILPDLLRFCYNEVDRWVSSARYTVPPADRLPPRKRLMTSDLRSRSSLSEEMDPNDPQLVVISRVDGYFHLACPFYIYKPDKHQGCLLQHDLQSVEDVIRHLQEFHMEPPYCPICYRVFENAMDRDNHVRGRSCQSRKVGDIEGIDERQKITLAKRDKWFLGEKERWLRLWNGIFPNVRLHRSPYLEGRAEREISMVRDRWACHGKEYVLQYYQLHGLHHARQPSDKRTSDALGKRILEGLLEWKLREQHII